MLQSLERQSGLPLALDPAAGSIRWESGITMSRESTRTFSDIQPFIADPAARSTADPIYRMYRNVARTEDTASIQRQKLRYDITVIRPGYFVGKHKEFFRTAGHYHPVKPGTMIAYPEVYEVISGRAYWLIQRAHPGNALAIAEAYVIEAGPGEKVIILPGFGHTSVNALAEPLVLANWISDTFEFDYEPYHRARGAAYWMAEGASAEVIEFIRNPNYPSVPELKKLRPKEVPEFDLLRSKPAYALAHELESLRFLSDPEEFEELLTIEKCYRTL